MLFAFVVLAGVIISMLLGIFPDHLAYLALGMSILSFVIYGLDKNAAEKGDRRTPENVLHLFSVLGGWPGALIAQQGFRHKNRKTSFQSVFWLTVIVNLGLMAWLWRNENLASLVAQVIGQ